MNEQFVEMKAHLWQTLWNYNDRRAQPQCSSFEDFSDCVAQILVEFDELDLLFRAPTSPMLERERKAVQAVERSYRQLVTDWAERIHETNLVHIWNIIAGTIRFPGASLPYETKGLWVTVNPQKFYLQNRYHGSSEQTNLRLAEHMFLDEWYRMYSNYETALRFQSCRVKKELERISNDWLAMSILRPVKTDGSVREYLESAFPVIVARCAELEKTAAWSSASYRDVGLEDEIADSRIYSHMGNSKVRDNLSLQKFNYEELHWAMRLLALEYVGRAENLLYHVGLDFQLRTGRKVEMVFGDLGGRDTYMLRIDDKLYNFGARVGIPAREMTVRHCWGMLDTLAQDIMGSNHYSRSSILANVHYDARWFFGIKPHPTAE